MTNPIETLIEKLQEHSEAGRWDRVWFYSEQIIILARLNYRRPVPNDSDAEDKEYLPTSQRRADDKTFP